MAHDYTLYASRKSAAAAWKKFIKDAPEGFEVGAVEYKQKKGKTYVLVTVPDEMQTAAHAEFIADLNERFEIVSPADKAAPKPKREWTPPVMSPNGFRPGSKRALSQQLLEAGTTIAHAEEVLGWTKPVVLSQFHETAKMLERDIAKSTNAAGEIVYGLAG